MKKISEFVALAWITIASWLFIAFASYSGIAVYEYVNPRTECLPKTIHPIQPLARHDLSIPKHTNVA